MFTEVQVAASSTNVKRRIRRASGSDRTVERMPRVDVLIVDDDPDVVETLRDTLIDEGLNVAIAHDGEEALDYLSIAVPPGVILLDWAMPKGGGEAFRARQQADHRIANVPVVVLTADTRVETRAKATGTAAVLHKPAPYDKLVSLLVNLIQR
jgi:CheY-like chemotaxis protein